LQSDTFLEALLQLPELWGPKVSRDGQWVAWTWFQVGPAADVFVAPTDASAPPLRLTQTKDHTFLVSWTPDSKAVIVQQDRDGNERVQLFRIDLDSPGEMQPLTEADPNYFLRGGDLHPNGDWLVYGANFDLETGKEIEPTRVYRHDLQNGERVALALPEKGAYTRPKLSPLGTHVLYERKDLHPAGRQVWLVDIEGREDREILNFGDQVKAMASWFPNGQQVLVIGETKTHRRVGVWELKDGSLRWLIDDPDRNIEAAFVPHGSRHVVIVEVVQACVRSSLLVAETGQETPLPEMKGNLVPIAPVGNDEWIARIFSSKQPDELVRLDISNLDPQSFINLSRVWERTRITPDDLTPAQDFRWKSVDGLEIQGWLYRPRGKARGTIVEVHGGPSYHLMDKVSLETQYYVHHGFNVFEPNYRGSTGFSLAFREAIKKDGWGGIEQEDIRTGIEALIEAGIAERGKVGVTGTSYGGYSAWCAITRYPPEIVTAAAPVCGMTDLVVDFETTRADLRPLSAEMMGGTPEEVPERYRERSPLYFVENIQGKLLIVQGLQDPNVTPKNVTAVREALEKAGVPYEVLAFEDEGHGIAKPKNLKVLLPGLLAFFDASFAPEA
jgi:dipeptidyl aminopeptidase/acylaminoacyl peptidase